MLIPFLLEKTADLLNTFVNLDYFKVDVVAETAIGRMLVTYTKLD